ncbi:MAG: methyltransferase domain-containing protein, partial [Rubrobacter sp.]|nr:methyltransferase domain-containing protein [Rubrobacter sp.]
MASLKRQTVFEITSGLKAFLSFEVGATRGQAPFTPEHPGKTQKPRDEKRREVFIGSLKELEPGGLLDLGCGKGGFALAARNLGWSVTAVDYSLEAMPSAPGVDWVHADVRKFGIGSYECIRLFGALYSLGLSEQLDLLQRCSDSPTIIEARSVSKPYREQRGYKGQMVEDSFWPAEKTLVRMAHASGFSSV